MARRHESNTPNSGTCALRAVKAVDPLELFLWTFRRNERDIVRLYDSLSDVMTLATGGTMINFGLWEDDTSEPISAQRNLCELFARAADLASGEVVLDVGCGYAAPAAQWLVSRSPEIFCVNINMRQLHEAQRDLQVASAVRAGSIHLIGATATSLPFGDEIADKVLAFESPQHFKPLSAFLDESQRVLKPGGTLAMALPVVSDHLQAPLVKLGLLAMTWSSEHYAEEFVLSELKKAGFVLMGRDEIGSMVYVPLADYYLQHRPKIRRRLLNRYPAYVETILYMSMRKMRQVSKDGIIGYLVLTCKKG